MKKMKKSDLQTNVFFKMFLKMFFFVLVVFGLGVVGVAAPGDGNPSEVLDAYFSQKAGAKSFNGAVLIAKQGEIILEKGYGMADFSREIRNNQETLFAIASMTKAFTAVSILMLEERGLLSVDDTVDRFIPGFPGGETITIHHLLNHSSGLYTYLGDFSSIAWEYLDQYHRPEELLEYFVHVPRAFESGSQWQYSNSNYVVLGIIIETVSGLSFGEFLKVNILKPLNMNHTLYDPGETRFPNKKAVGYYDITLSPPSLDMAWTPSILHGAGGMYASVSDLYKWDRALYTEKLVSRKSLEKIFTPYLADYGYGWWIWNLEHNGTQHKYIQHSGAFPGFHSMFVRMVDDDITIILLENFPTYVYGSAAHFDLLWIARDIALMLLDSH